MGYIEVNGIGHTLADGRELFRDVSFRVGEGAKVALVGANGTGKTTLLRVVAGDLAPATGSVSRVGGVGVMRQFIGSVRDNITVRDFLLALAPPNLRAAGDALDAIELVMMERDDEETHMAYAVALSAWGDAGGYDTEVLWGTVTVAALGIPFNHAQYRMMSTLSGGEQKRLALEVLLRGPDEALLLDEPDNYLDVPGKRWLEQRLRDTTKTVLYVSHDRELLNRTATRIVTIEGHSAWVHGGGFISYHQARLTRTDRLDELHRRWNEDYQRLKDLVRTLQQQAANSPAMSSKYRAMQTRLRKFEEAGPPPERPAEQNVQIRLTGGRTGVRAVTCERLELTSLMKPFDLELFYGERVGVLGSNGSGKSHFLRLLAESSSDGSHHATVLHTGSCRLGARVIPGYFAQTHEHPEFIDRTLTELLWHGHGARTGLDRGKAIAKLRRYELTESADQTFGTLSGGQQARFQILLLELAGCTLLLLDEPTDNLDLHSAEALEEGLRGFAGTVVAVTHDRWFARGFDRFMIFAEDGQVRETDGPEWGTGRVERTR